MRARMAIAYSGIQVELREVVLKNKPAKLLQISSKGTVPVLLNGEEVIDESCDIIRWALQQHDPDHWLESHNHPLISENDNDFKKVLDRYKYADRFPEHSQRYYRTLGETFLQKLELLLTEHRFIYSDQLSYVDIAIFPFIRQFALVDKAWFDQAPYPCLQAWLQTHLNSTLFNRCMQKYQAWQPDDKQVTFP